MTGKFLLIILLAVFPTERLGASVDNQSKKSILSSFCELTLSDDQKHANLTFTDIYTIRLNEYGGVKDVRPFQAKHTKLTELAACLKDWRFRGFAPQSVAHVEFTWKHGHGWTQMRISSKDFSQITIIGDGL